MTISLVAGLAGGAASSSLGFGFGIGYSIASSAASYFTQEDVVNEGQQLNDLSVRASVYGSPIPIVFGTMPVDAVPLWAVDKIPIRHEQESGGGKGSGPTVTNVSYSYVADFAVSLCEGPIVGVKRIWAGTTLLYDVGEGATAETLLASNSRADGITIYTGSETQEPDPLIESYAGAGNVPAFLGQAYIVFNRLDLSPWGGAIPPIRVEVVGSGSTALAGKVADDTTHNTNYGSMAVTGYDNGVFRIWDKRETALYDPGIVYLVDANCNYLGEEAVPVESLRRFTQDNYPLYLADHYEIGTLGSGEGTYYIYRNKAGGLPESGGGPVALFALYAGSTTADYPVKNFSLDVAPDREMIGYAVSADHKRFLVLQGEVGASATAISNSGVWYLFDETCALIDNGTCDYSGNSSGGSQGVFGFGHVSAAISIPICMLESDYTHLWTYNTNHTTLWTLEDGVFSFHSNSLPDTADISSTKPPSMWADNGVAFIAGQDNTGTLGSVATFSRDELFTTTSVPISDMVDALETRSNLTSADINNSGIVGSLPGYRFIGPATLRSAIEPLQQAGYFDIVESDDVLKAVSRGGAVAAVIPEEDLGAYDEGTAPPPVHQLTHGQETELPVEVVVGYMNPGRSYEIGLGDSRRLVTRSKHKVNITLPIAMDDDRGRQTAEILHYNAWTERNRHEISLDMRYMRLEPSDVVQYTKGGNVHTMRITESDMTPAGVIRLRGVSERASVYSSNAVGADITTTSPGIGLVGPTKFIPLDLPMLRNGHDDEAFYMAGGSYYPSWVGASVFRSNDLGASYTPITTINSSATHGVTTDALGDTPNPILWDKANSVNVKLPSGTLSSSTIDGVLNGANAGALGSPENGWEIIQWLTAVLEADGSYTLSGLLRGRLGTEWATGIHGIGDTFVLLNSAVIRESAVLNVERLYKAVTFGNFAEAAASQAFTYGGENLKPYSPFNMKTKRDAAGNITFTWQRRSRFVPSPLWGAILGEDSEKYEIDIYEDGTYTTVKRTITVTSESATYTAAEQVDDFGATQATVYRRLYQISAKVNRGHALEEAA